MRSEIPISLMLMNFTLFNDTIYNNIAYGELSCLDTKLVHDAAKFSYALDFINELPDKFDTMVGKMGYFYRVDRDKG